MPGNRVLTLRAALSILPPLLAAIQGCDRGNYNPGAGREDVSFFVLVGEPTGDSLQPLLGVELPSEAGMFQNGTVLESLNEIGVRTAVYAPVTPADGYPEGDPNLRGILDCGMQVILEFPLSTGDVPEEGYPLLSQAVRQCTDTTLLGQRVSCADILITSPDPDLRDPDARFLSAGEMAAAVQTLRSEFPTLSIGAGGWTLRSDRWRGVASALTGALGGAAARPDFISFRLPPGMPSDISPLVSEFHDLLQEEGLGETELVLYGWTPEDVHASGCLPSHALIAAWWINLQSAGLADAILVPGAEWSVYSEGAVSLAGILSLLSECAEYPARLASSVTMNGDQWSEPDDINRLWVLAGEDGSGKVAVLLANMTPETATVEVTYLVPSLNTGSRIDVLRVDPSDDRTFRTGSHGRSVEIVPQEALLVIAAPV